MLKILIADAHALMRKGLIEVLRKGGVAALVGEAGTGQEVLAMVQSDKWDVVILDIDLRSGGSLETLAALRREQPDLPVVMHGLHNDPMLAWRCQALGAVGYTLKSADPIELICAIEAALKHQFQISNQIAPVSAGMVTLTKTNGKPDP
jgi:DNA-binding NarL/FixJ family response regulator